jgi:hypothetical protein
LAEPVFELGRQFDGSDRVEAVVTERHMPIDNFSARTQAPLEPL